MRVASNKFYIGFVVVVTAFLAVAFVKHDTSRFAEIPLEAVAPNVSPFSEYERGKVVEIIDEQRDDLGDDSSLERIVQTAKVELTTGDKAGETTEVTHEVVDPRQVLKVNSKVVLAYLGEEQIISGNEYVVIDIYRLPGIGIFVLLFIALAIIFGRWHGLTAILGLAFSLVVLLYYLAPQILSGANPVVAAIIAAVVIAIVSIYVAHGFNRRTTLAVVSTIVVLFLAEGLAAVAVKIFHLFGNGSEEVFLLQATSLGALDLQGVLLASIIIGTLGILDDITTAQSAAVEELYLANSSVSLRELYNKAMSIGREHIASLINTLVLVYAGAFFPLFLVIVLNFHQPIWVVLNSEFIAEEIVRALVGSTALVLAVPLSSILASWYFTRRHKKTTPS